MLDRKGTFWGKKPTKMKVLNLVELALRHLALQRFLEKCFASALLAQLLLVAVNVLAYSI